MASTDLSILGFIAQFHGNHQTAELQQKIGDPSLIPFIEVLGHSALRFKSSRGKTYDLLDAEHKYNNSGKMFKFKRKYNTLTNTDGWAPAHVQGFDAVNGGMVIHDITEHLPQNEYGVAQEYIAQGAVVAFRYNGEYWGRKKIADNSTGEILDVPQTHNEPAFDMLFAHMIRGGLATETCPMHPLCVVPLGNPQAEFQLIRMTAFARELAFSAKYINHSSYLSSSLVQALGWMRLGYRLTVQRYKGVDLKNFAIAFREAADAVNNITKISTEGDMVIIKPSPEKGTIQVSHIRNVGPGNRVVGSELG